MAVNSKIIVEDICKNRKAMGLVGLMKPVDLMKSLVKNLGLIPKDAAKVIYDLKVKSNEGMSFPGVETNKQYPVPPMNKKETEQEESVSLGRPDGKVSFYGFDPGKGGFPADPIEEPCDYPYDDTFVNYMNSPKRKMKMKDAKDFKVKFKKATDTKLTQRRAGGDGGKGIYSKTVSQDPAGGGDMAGSGTSWSTRGRPGWSSSPKGKEFDLPQNHAKQKKPKENALKSLPNAGDSDESTPSFMKEPNVGQTIWDPKTGRSGTSNYRKMPYRGYTKK